MPKKTKKTKTELDRERRMKWWHEARFGMFVHWGLYSQLGRHEWAMNTERIPIKEYEKLAGTWQVKDRPAREWARLAKKAGMKYMVMTTKHHEGYCLWDSETNPFNSVKHTPGKDLVQEFVDACREYDLKIGFYYSLMDWHHPDGARCFKNEAARKRFTEYTQGLVRELMTNYGKIDVLWYDVPWPLKTPEGWDSKRLNKMVRKHQPDIIINNRSRLPEDFGTPEESIVAAESGRAWEACMTFNGSWGYLPYSHPEDWHSSRKVVQMLHQVRSGAGNLLLNIGPAPDGSVPPEATERLLPVGKWLKQNGEVVYGKADRNDGCFHSSRLGWFSRQGNTAYFWCKWWPGKEINLGGFSSKLKKASYVATGKNIRFKQTKTQIKLLGLPNKSPDKAAGITVIRLEFASRPKQQLGAGCVILKGDWR